MKKILPIILCLSFIICLSACSYNPPEGYTEEHHTYEEILVFAKAIDPNATVSTEYVDTTIEDWNRNFREYPAIINGIECHVASVGKMVWNEGFCAGEFARQYYIIDTDYDYLILQKILSEKQAEWNMEYEGLAVKYQWNNILSVEIAVAKITALTDEELELVWQDILEIATEYNTYTVRKEPYFSLSAPEKYYDSGKTEYFVKTDAYVLIHDLSEQGKVDFFQEYHDAWALLDSGLPIG